MNLCITNGIIICTKEHKLEKGTLYITNKKIVCIETDSFKEGDRPLKIDREIDASNKIVVPGLIDLHVHFREPGFEEKEDIFSGCLAAAAGGFTTVCCMPNTNPCIDFPSIVSYVDKKASLGCGVSVLPIASITKGQKGKELCDFKDLCSCETRCKELTGRGVCAVSEDGKSVSDAHIKMSAMLKAKECGLPVFAHTEDETLSGTKIGEELIVARDILLAKETSAHLHLCHLSTKGSVELLAWAKDKGVAISAETAPHYFWFSKKDKANGLTKMNPPLRDERDKDAIKKAVEEGLIDVIATDHAPHCENEKNCSYEDALNGISGLETSFAASYTALVKNGNLSLCELIKRMSTRPAQILGIERGSLELGSVADVSIFDISDKTGGFVVDRQSFKSKGKNSIFEGQKLYGKTVCTIVDGSIVFEA